MNVMPLRRDLDPARPLEPAPTAGMLWGPSLAVLGAGLAILLGLLFREEVTAAVGIWETSTAYNHCWLVLPVVLWLAWVRRDRLRGLAPAPLPAAVLLALPAAAAWFAADRLGIMEGRQLAVIGLVWSLFLGVLGLRVCRAMAGPLLYMVFLVPFGAFITPVLQDVTAWMIDVMLDIARIPHFVDRLIIEIPEGTFEVAEACAGLRFLIAAIAFGALYAMEMFRSPGRRLIVLALSVIVPVIANGIRAFGIVLLGHILGSAEAGAADHVLYGWIFFSIVILLLILAGLPFREDLTPAPDRAAAAAGPAASPPGRVAILAAAALVLATAASGPAVAAALQGRWGTAVPEVQALRLAPSSGCVAEGSGLRCGPAGQAVLVSAQALRFPPRAGWSALGAARAGALGAVDEHDTGFAIGAPGEPLWRVTLRYDAAAPRALAIALWLDGVPQAGGLQSRVRQALGSLRGSGEAPVMVVVEAVPAPGTPPRTETGSRREAERLQAILAEQTPAIAAMVAGAPASPPR